MVKSLFISSTDPAPIQSTNDAALLEDERRERRRQNLKFHRTFAHVAAGFFLVALIIASIAAGEWMNDRRTGDTRRILEENANDDNQEEGDFRLYSCHDIFIEAPEPGEKRCQFAHECNLGIGLFWKFSFCSKWPHTTWALILSPVILLWLVLLFRMLGSTAEDYFSPSLEMFSFKLGLPPRFAGVSLLALGNGAADVSATMNAITNDQQKGYILSLGALSGSAMFIGCFVTGVVIIVAKGVPCRGALVRDVFALFLTSIVVILNFKSGSIGPSSISLFCSMYLIFVVIVLVADVYHRAVVVPRLQQIADQQETERQISESQRVNQAADALSQAAVGNGDTTTTTTNNNNNQNNSQSRGQSMVNTVITAISNYDNNPAHADGWGVESHDLVNERPVVLHGAGGVIKDTTAGHQSTGDDDENNAPQSGNYAMLEDGVDQICAQPGSGSYSASNWRGAWHDGLYELEMDIHDVWREIFDEPENQIWDKFLLVCEFPFTVFRKITVAIPCEGNYCRATVALSIALSPVWVTYYLWSGYKVPVFSNGNWIYVLIVCLICFSMGAAILRYAPGGEGVMSLYLSTPIALYGFAIAATWIDFISARLVSLLDYLGIVLHIPGSIMGLTILAWGNSMGDLSADVTMARKGLANMAMTACFAGPVFNILIGLSLGFLSLLAKTGQAEKEVKLYNETMTGFIFAMINAVCIILLGGFVLKGRIPKEYGYGMVVFYMVYVTLSVIMGLSGSF